MRLPTRLPLMLRFLGPACIATLAVGVFVVNRYTPVQIATPSSLCLLVVVAVALTRDTVATLLTLSTALLAAVLLAFQPVNVDTWIGTAVRILMGCILLPTVTLIVLWMGRRLERQYAQTAAAEREWFHQVIHSLQDPIVETDWQSITDANPAFLRLSGFSPQELIGTKGPFPFFPEDQIAPFAAALEASMRGERSDFQLTLLRKDGRRLPVLFSVSRLLGGSPPNHRMVYTFRDISSLRAG
jgi:PAS domain S-box-containing protein